MQELHVDEADEEKEEGGGTVAANDTLQEERRPSCALSPRRFLDGPPEEICNGADETIGEEGSKRLLKPVPSIGQVRGQEDPPKGDMEIILEGVGQGGVNEDKKTSRRGKKMAPRQ